MSDGRFMLYYIKMGKQAERKKLIREFLESLNKYILLCRTKCPTLAYWQNLFENDREKWEKRLKQ